MNLDWGFYYDSWLIDKLPDDMEIKVIDKGNGPECYPESLTCYFGANPMYLYGEGKLWHESLVSTRGMAIYPEFLGRPGFEFVDRNTFSITFDEKYDFHGVEVESKHVGEINATRFMKDVSRAMYGIQEEDYSNLSTPSVSLRKLDSEDMKKISDGVSGSQVFQTVEEMRSSGCHFYCRMFIEDLSVGPKEEISGKYLEMVSPGAIPSVAGLFTNVAFLKYSHLIIPKEYIVDSVKDNFTILFKTVSNFRSGTILDFGSTNYSEMENYGFSVDIDSRSITVTLNDGTQNVNSVFFLVETDFRFPHRIMLSRSGHSLILSMDGEMVETKDISSIGSIRYSEDYSNYVSRRSMYEENVQTGDIEEIAIFDSTLDATYIDKYFGEPIPILKMGGASQLEDEEIPRSLSYGLTYDRPAELFLPNFFGADFDKHYIKNREGLVLIAGYDGTATSGSYDSSLEPHEDSSLVLPDGFKVDQSIGKDLKETIPVLTKLTSDTHVPIRIHMDFKVPSHFYSKDTTYNMRIVLKSLHRFMWYHFKKYKTGEWI